MNEKEILKKRLDEIKKELATLEVPSEEMEKLINEMFKKLETRMEQIDATGKTLQDDIDMYKNQFVQYVKGLYREMQERSSHRVEVDEANKLLEQEDTNEVSQLFTQDKKSVKYHIEEIPNALAHDSYENKVTDQMIDYFGIIGNQLKIKYAPNLAEFMKSSSYGMGTFSSSRAAIKADDMDNILRKLKTEYDEQILQILKSDKSVAVGKVEEIIQKLEFDLMINVGKEFGLSTEKVVEMVFSSGATQSSVNAETTEIKNVENLRAISKRLPAVRSNGSKLKELARQLPKVRDNNQRGE